MHYRKIGILMAFCLLAAACQYSVPLSTEHNVAIDSALLGNWAMQPEIDDPRASLDSMTVMRFSTSEYLLRYVSEGSELLFRAYLINPGGEQLLQLELLEDSDGPVSHDENANLFMVARYALDGEVLTVGTMNVALVSDEIDNTEALLKAYLEHKDDPELFMDQARFKKT